MTKTSGPNPRERYKTLSAVNDLLGLSSAVALLVDGISGRLRDEEFEETLTEEQEERLAELFLKLRSCADDTADFAREIAEQSRQ
jgi:hypothetical protein